MVKRERTPASLGPSTVELFEVRHTFEQGRFLFQPISMSLEAGTRYALTGPSGSGKSTLLSILAGWLSPTSGTVRKTGVDTIGWVFQNPHGSPRRSVLDHVTLPLLAQSIEPAAARDKATQILDEFGLLHRMNEAFRVLSGGEAQRLMLARAVAFAPDLLLIDEPTAQLDMHTAQTVIEVIRRVSLKGSIIVIATHDQRTSEACDVRVTLTA